MAKEHGGILKYVQMSCLAATPQSPSRLLRSKHAAEEAVLQNFPEVWLPPLPFILVWLYRCWNALIFLIVMQATILRAAPMVGVEDRLLNRWAIQAKKLPAVPIPGDGLSK